MPPRVAILCPFYKETNPLTMVSLLRLVDKTRMQVLLNYGDAFIAHSRNKLAEQFLRTDAEWAFTVDDDVILPCGNAKWFNEVTGFNLPEELAGRTALDRLLSHGKTLVGGLYFGRWRNGKPMYAEGQQDSEWVRKVPDVCKPTRWVATGAMLIHRSVFEDIERKFPQLARDSEGNHSNFFTSSEHDLTAAVEEVANLLNEELTVGDGTSDARIAKARSILARAQAMSNRHSRLGTGEDVIFCTRAAQAGHQPHVDCGLLCGHVGAYVYGPKKVV